MSERTEVSFDAALMMALRADAQKELDELPSPAQLKERYPDTSRWDARLQAALHKRRPVLKRVLIAVAGNFNSRRACSKCRVPQGSLYDDSKISAHCDAADVSDGW